jgi:hypothetical protein
MRTIWKFRIQPTHLGMLSTIAMPLGAKILCVQAQDGVANIWAMIPDTNAGDVDRTFEVFATGGAINEASRSYVGTFQISGGEYIFHVFERLN